MLQKLFSYIMSAVIFICALFGIRIVGGASEEMITYNKSQTVVTISLEENPSTGYAWQYEASADGFVQLCGDDYHSDAPAGVVGAGGIRALSFVGQQAGTVTLTFRYLRSWEGDPIRTVKIECTVTSDRVIEAKLLSDNG